VRVYRVEFSFSLGQGQPSQPAAGAAGAPQTVCPFGKRPTHPRCHGERYRLYLSKDWADDAERRDKAHVPEAIRFKTKPQIALAQIRAALAAGVARGVVDASYGTNTAFRTGIGALGLTYVAAILSTVKVRAAADPHDRVSVKALALGLPNHAWRTITFSTPQGPGAGKSTFTVRRRVGALKRGRGRSPAPTRSRAASHAFLALQPLLRSGEFLGLSPTTRSLRKHI
jgi:DDE superfamily endonuclease